MSLLVLLVVTWCGGVSLQHIEEVPEDTPLYHQPPEYNSDPFEQAPFEDADFYRNDNDAISYYPGDGQEMNSGNFGESDIDDFNRNRRWAPNLIDTDQTSYTKVDKDQKFSTFASEPLQSLTEAFQDTSPQEIEIKTKRGFSPWGGKRSQSEFNFDPDRYYTWSWKRTPSRDSNMPKRVRFSPWGGKRSAHVIFKPNKATRIIYTSLTPELWLQRFNSKSQGSDVLPFKTNKMKYRLLKFKRGEYNFLKGKLPFYDFAHDANTLKMPMKDGKRKVKFSAWGGKRSPPVIGPVWRPASESAKSLLNSVVLYSDEASKSGRLKL